MLNTDDGSNPQYTPAPWQAFDCFIGTQETDPQTIAYADSDPQTITYTSDHRNRQRRLEAESIANAHLIAAAPELLEALIALLAKIDNSSLDDWKEYHHCSTIKIPEIVKAQAVIAKALNRCA